MFTDFVLACLHHLLVFGLFGVFLVEMASVRPGLDGAAIRRLARYDAVYGALALAVILAGILRLLFGLKGWDYYAGNHAFWGKMTAFALVGLLSVPPSLRFARWKKALAADPGFLPPSDEIRAARRFLHAEAFFFALIPLFAAAMARGLG
ncbi:hypothetical protein GCM10011390_14130 [Aureimonas endophytica]|uniref:DUF2214 family protein n=1 Tax=Aureimonas endophytica TaxID=2027858 RepID=A0A916ZGM8_9HYPH|nr:DUF2214 family protein [Aureimonas endophytica]GGD96499.1 hypothetical protein GCM10011390_14130 [Aureimonas endophytica]